MKLCAMAIITQSGVVDNEVDEEVVEEVDEEVDGEVMGWQPPGSSPVAPS